MFRLAIVYAAAAVLAAPLTAQSLAPDNNQIPAEQRPPAGMCRIWIDGVPPGRQPAPTDCATAIRNRPPNARVIFGAGARAPRREQRPQQPPAPVARPDRPDSGRKEKEKRPPEPPSRAALGSRP